MMCDIFMPSGLKWVYPYVFAYYYYYGPAFYEEHWKQFEYWLRDLFYVKNYIPKLIEKEGFEFFMRYFKELKGDDVYYYRVTGKKYVLDFMKENDSEKVYVEMALELVHKWCTNIKI